MKRPASNTFSQRERLRGEVLHQLCLQIEASRADGLTVRRAVQKARRRPRSVLGVRGRLSLGGMTMLYYRWITQRSPKAFTRNYRPRKPVIPPALVEEFLNRLVTDRVVPASAVMASLRADWQMGKSLPGLGTWRDYWRRKHGEDSPRGMPPPFPVSRSTFYAFLATSAPADYQKRIAVALSAQRELSRFLSFIESRRSALALKRRHESLGAQISPQS